MYRIIKPRSTARKVIGSGTKPKIEPNVVNGRINARIRITNILANSNLFGLLRKKGTVLVLITNMMSVWVNNDSTNHAVWNSGAVALKTYSITKKVAKSKMELTGPNTSIKLRIKEVCIRCGCWT